MKSQGRLEAGRGCRMSSRDVVEGGLAELIQRKLSEIDTSPDGKLSLVDTFCG